MEDRPAPAQRLELARLTRGFKTAKEAALFFGWPYATYAQHENGERGIGRQSAKYAAAYRVGEGWLLTGEGMGPEANDDDAAVSERTKGQPIRYVPGDQIVVADKRIRLPVYAGAAGGSGKIIVSPDIVDRVDMPAALADVKGAYGVMIDGESMIPAYEPGDVAWVNPHLRPMRGKNHIFYHTPPLGEDAEAIIKRLDGWNDRDWDLWQWNPAKAFKESRKIWPVCHRVVGKYDAA
jgi:phage repressor protein C with HTH and peptisase S24 domain